MMCKLKSRKIKKKRGRRGLQGAGGQAERDPGTCTGTHSSTSPARLPAPGSLLLEQARCVFVVGVWWLGGRVDG